MKIIFFESCGFLLVPPLKESHLKKLAVILRVDYYAVFYSERANNISVDDSWVGIIPIKGC